MLYVCLYREIVAKRCIVVVLGELFLYVGL